MLKPNYITENIHKVSKKKKKLGKTQTKLKKGHYGFRKM